MLTKFQYALVSVYKQGYCLRLKTRPSVEAQSTLEELGAKKAFLEQH
jgi:hypothetical protein